MLNIQEKIRHLFETNRVLDMPSLQTQFGNRTTRSIFRDLKNEGYYSSFSHSGKYHTLKKNPHFNSDGLWFYHEIGFSKYGTLKNTLINLIKNSDAGKTHDTLKQQLHLRVQNTLFDLVKENRIIRKEIDGNYVYFSENIDHAKKQIGLREEYHAISASTHYPDWIIMEILASIIRTIDVEEIQSEKIISELDSRKITVTKNQIEYILNKYDLKKTLDSQ